MSTKTPIASGENFYFFHESLFDKEINHIFISVTNPENCKTERTSSGDIVSQLSLSSIDMDKIAVAWIKERQLQPAFGGPVGKEYGSSDCEYD
ncbi:MAG: hypothetical protein QM500_09185 [Methylococcales bacterium]